jgi:DHA1 family bicyclomycin/chloramphenicol resistance-like MFS transporter
MYLPALPTLEQVFHTSTAEVQRTLAAFFLGFSCGQSLWGPITDRYGRRLPLYFSLTIFFITSAACALSPSIELLILLRLIQSVSACGGAVIARAMIRDLFPPEETRRAFSTLIMLNATAPAVAPLVGGVLLAWLGWASIFWALAIAGALALLLMHFMLPESLHEDAVQPLNLGSVLRNYGLLLRDRTFLGASLATGLASAGMFVYITGSPFVFMEFYKVSPEFFAMLFGMNALGVILVSRFNSRVLHRFPAARILRVANLIQFVSGLALVAAAVTRAGVLATWAPLFTYVSCIGLTFPNGSALSMAKHARIAGIASALLGTNQFGLAAIATTILGSLPNSTPVPMALMIAICGCLAVAINFAALRGPAAEVAT